MTGELRFSIKAMLGCMTALSVPLAVIAAGFPLVGAVILILAVVGSFIYLKEGRKGIAQAAIAMSIVLLIIGGWIAFVVIHLLYFGDA